MSKIKDSLTLLPRQLRSLLATLLLMSFIQDSSTQTVANLTDIGCSVKSCASLDVALLQDYVTGLQSSLNDTDQRLNEFSGKEEPLQPFGALASDWPRLFLLQNSQPEGSPLRDNLLRLARIIVAAYSHGRFEKNDTTATSSSGRKDSLVPDSEDQQANNVTLGSTAQKESARINTSSSSSAYNNETADETAAKEARTEKFSGNYGNEDDSTPTSYYVESISANFNQAFSTLVSLDNEASGNKSNETSPAADNEDESTTETWLESFSPSSAGPASTSSSSSSLSLPDDREDLLGFASSTTTESNLANEAVHYLSKENFLISKYASKEARDNDEDDFVARFFEHESVPVSGQDSMEDLLALMDLEEAERSANDSRATDSTPVEIGNSTDSFESNTTDSLEALLDLMEEFDSSTIVADLSINGSTDFENSDLSETTPVVFTDDTTTDFLDSSELQELVDGLSAETESSQLVRVISGEILADTTRYSSEVADTTVADRLENEGTDRFEEVTDTTVPSLLEEESGLAKNHTEDREHGSVEATTIGDDFTIDWDSTLPIDETTDSYDAEPHHNSRKILMIFRHQDRSGDDQSSEAMASSSWKTKVASMESSTFNSRFLGNRMNRKPEIAERNKRNSVELLDVERQYRTFRSEPGKT